MKAKIEDQVLIYEKMIEDTDYIIENIDDYDKVVSTFEEILGNIRSRRKELEESIKTPCNNCQGGGCPVCNGGGIIHG